MTKEQANVMYSSKSEEWATPQAFFDELNKEFDFTLDPCATTENAKCERFFTKAQDGLSQSWKGERVFCNPPYGRNIVKWVSKAYTETVAGGGYACCNAVTRSHRHTVFSRLHIQEIGNTLYSRKATF